MKATRQHYMAWLETLEWSHTATIRTNYKMKPHLVNKFCDIILKQYSAVDMIFYTIENDKDFMGNHAHLLIKQDRATPLSLESKKPFAVPYYEYITDKSAITTYTTKYLDYGIDYDLIIR